MPNIEQIKKEFLEIADSIAITAGNAEKNDEMVADWWLSKFQEVVDQAIGENFTPEIPIDRFAEQYFRGINEERSRIRSLLSTKLRK